MRGKWRAWAAVVAVGMMVGANPVVSQVDWMEQWPTATLGGSTPDAPITVECTLGHAPRVYNGPCIIDTGAEADVVVGSSLATRLGITSAIQSSALGIGGAVNDGLGTSTLSVAGQTVPTGVVIVPSTVGGEPLIGVSMLRKLGSVMLVDFKDQQVAMWGGKF